MSVSFPALEEVVEVRLDMGLRPGDDLVLERRSNGLRFTVCIEAVFIDARILGPQIPYMLENVNQLHVHRCRYDFHRIYSTSQTIVFAC